jgi:hypothetical protein
MTTWAESLSPVELLMRELDRVACVREMKSWQPTIERADRLAAAQAIKVQADVWRFAFYELLKFESTVG